MVTKYEHPPAEGILAGPQMSTEIRSKAVPARLMSMSLIVEGSLVPLPLIQAGHSKFLRSDARTDPPNP